MMLTRQEIFDKAWSGLEFQGFRRSATSAGCAYRGDGGLRCALGWLIPDERYHHSLEGRGVGEPEVLNATGISHEDADFAIALQGVHDFARGATEMERRLLAFARKHDLAIPGERP